jgi:inosine/xanthosine triphosphate pyrophosphatase family protein
MSTQHSDAPRLAAPYLAGKRAVNSRCSSAALALLSVDSATVDRALFQRGMADELASRIKGLSLVLQTSNALKLAEFRRFGLSIDARSGADLAEVEGTPEEVVQYKALAAGPGILVEDTSLDVEGYDAGVNIRWLLQTITARMLADPAQPEPKAVWRVMMAVHYDGRMYTAGAEVQGRLIPRPRGLGFSFDCYFVPSGYEQTLGEMDAAGTKDLVSARKHEHAPALGRQISSEHLTALPTQWPKSYKRNHGHALEHHHTAHLRRRTVHVRMERVFA